MPYHKGVFAATLLLIVCLGTNMSAFPKVWQMFPHDSPMEDTVSPLVLPTPTSGPDKAILIPPKSVSTDKPIPIEPSAPKKEEPTPAPKKEEPTPATEKEEPTPASKKEEPTPAPKKEEPTPASKKEEPTPATEEEELAPKPEQPDEESKCESERATAFAPIVPLGLQESDKLESLLPKTEPVDPFTSAAAVSPTYTKEFQSRSPEEPRRVAPMYVTVDSVLALPIVYESHPTIDQRVGGQRKIVPLPPTDSSLRPLVPISPTGPVRRLPATN